MTEPKVVRYDYDWHDMAKHPRGEYVRHSDYEALAARVEELEKRLAAYTPLPGYNVIHAENTRLREALVGIGAAAMRWKMRAGEVGDRVRSREGIQHTINLVEAALKEKP